MTLSDSLSWRHSFACGLHDGKPCNCKDDADADADYGKTADELHRESVARRYAALSLTNEPVVRDPGAWAAVAKAGR